MKKFICNEDQIFCLELLEKVDFHAHRELNLYFKKSNEYEPLYSVNYIYIHSDFIGLCKKIYFSREDLEKIMDNIYKRLKRFLENDEIILNLDLNECLDECVRYKIVNIESNEKVE